MYMTNEDLSILKNTASRVERWVGRGDFLIYGGIISDLLNGVFNQACDIDMAFHFESEIQILRVIKSLAENGFRIIADRDYYIRNTHYVRLLYAISDEAFLDIAFMNDPYEVGVLTMDSVYYSNQLSKIVDNYDGINDLQKKYIRLRDDAMDENPLYILNRIICVCSKYGISLKTVSVNNKIKESLISKKNECCENKDAISSFVSRLIKSIVDSKDQRAFISELIDEEILKTVFPILNNILERTLKNNKYIDSSSKHEFIMNTYKMAADDTEIEELAKCFALFKYRHWSKDEFSLAHTFPRFG